MDYSGDFDVAMLTAGSSADAWPYQSETIMDQDAHHDSQSTGAADRESVEVDMEETYPDHADHESVEYEMADEEEIYHHEGGDLLDVEVYDASQLHSPVPMPATIDTPQMTSGELVDFTIHVTPTFTDPHNTVEASTVPLDETHRLEHSAGELSSVETVPDSSPRFGVHEEPLDAAVALAESHTERAIDLSNAAQVVTDRLPHAALGTETAGEVTESSSSGVTHVEDSSHAHGEETELARTWSHGQDHEAAAHLDQPTEAERPEEDQNDAQQYYGYNEAIPDVADPHEISEGVYIDPPPAVLLSLPSADQPEVCLFNQPPTRAESLSPSEETHQSGQHVLTLLLHYRPTLYYEPLTNVFEALRQEEYITRIPEFAEGELALDAYDLQLIISEVRLLFLHVVHLPNGLLQDNAHAREVTLHDLNVLHDGSDLSGPLRLQLHLVVPRFIVRYHMLRDQISRLNLATEGGEEGEQVTGQQEHHNERMPFHIPFKVIPLNLIIVPLNAVECHHAEEYHQDDAQPDADNEDYQGQPLVQQNIGHSDDCTDPKPDPTDEQIAGDISNLTADHDYHQVQDDEAQTLEDEREFADADADTEANFHEDAGESLDAVHDNDLSDSVATVAPGGDAEPTEYEDHTEATEYDDRYGEVLPEQEGGEVSNQTSDHYVAADDEEPTDADNARDAPTEPDVEDAPVVDLTEPTGEQPTAAKEENYFSEGGVEGARLRRPLSTCC